MDKGIKIIIIMAVVILICEILIRVLRKKYYNKLTELLMEGKLDEFDQLIEKPLVRLTVYPFNRDYLKLQRHMIAGNKGRVNEIFELFKTRSLNEKQKKQIYPQAFNFYLALENGEQCAYYRDRINELKDDDVIKDAVNISYEICIEKRTDRLDDLLKETEEMEPNRRGVNEMLISQIYLNMGEKKKSQDYNKLAKKHLEAMKKELEEEAESL